MIKRNYKPCQVSRDSTPESPTRLFAFMKELPYFKFNCSEWISGSITLEDLTTQGAFINICAYYWFKSGNITLTEINRRLKLKQATINRLVEGNHIKLNGDVIEISFLREQFDERGMISDRNSKNGSKGGAPKGNKNAQKNNPEQPKTSNKEEEEEKKESRKEINIADKSATKTLDDRKNDFYNRLKPFVKDYSKKMIREFYDYWTESSPNGKKMRFEKQTVFEIKRRLVTWAKRAGIEPPEPQKPAQDRFSEAAYNKTLWTTEAWESHYGWRLESEPEFRQYFGYGELQKS